MFNELTGEISQQLQIILSTVHNCRRKVRENSISASEIISDLQDITKCVYRIDDIVNPKISAQRKLTRTTEIKINGEIRKVTTPIICRNKKGTQISHNEIVDKIVCLYLEKGKDVSYKSEKVWFNCLV